MFEIKAGKVLDTSKGLFSVNDIVRIDLSNLREVEGRISHIEEKQLWLDCSGLYNSDIRSVSYGSILDMQLMPIAEEDI